MSALARQLDDYLRLRRMLGHKLDDAARQLPWFVEHLDATDAEYVTDRPRRSAWALDRDLPAGSTVPGHADDGRARVRALPGRDRPAHRGPADRADPHPAHAGEPPFIYTDEDVLALMDAGAPLDPRSRCGPRPTRR